jgi:hypothetical protein
MLQSSITCCVDCRLAGLGWNFVSAVIMDCPVLHCSGPDGEAFVAPYDILIGAEPGSGSHLIADALAQMQLRQYTHKHPSGFAESVAPRHGYDSSATSPDQHQAIYGSLAAAAASGGAKAAALAATAIGGAQHDATASSNGTLGAAAKHSSKAGSSTAAAAAAAGFVELEFKSWGDMPHQRELKELLPAGSEALQASLDEVG